MAKRGRGRIIGPALVMLIVAAGLPLAPAAPLPGGALPATLPLGGLDGVDPLRHLPSAACGLVGAGLTGRCERWSASHPGGTAGAAAHGVAASPDGSRVYVTARAAGEGSRNGASDILTLAYDTTDGRLLWTSRYEGPGQGEDAPAGILAAPRADIVLVAGTSWGGSTGFDWVVLALHGSTGEVLWVARETGPAGSSDAAFGMDLDPTGSRLFVAGWREGGRNPFDLDYQVVAYDTATGSRMWSATFNGPDDGGDVALALAVSSDGARVYVTGESWKDGSAEDIVTLSLDASTGHEAWAARHATPGWDRAIRIAADPSGGTVVVAGGIAGPSFDAVVLAYDASTGALRWSATYAGPGGGYDFASALGFHPGGTEIYVASTSTGILSRWDFLVTAHELDSGSVLWRSRSDGRLGDDAAQALGVGHDGACVYITGRSDGPQVHADFLTIAYDSASGEERWRARHGGSIHGPASAKALTLLPQRNALVVSGTASSLQGSASIVTAAYDAPCSR